MTRGQRAALLTLLLATAVAQSVGQGSKPRVVPIDSAGFRTVLAGAAGGPVLVNFWATWCVPCLQEFPDLLKVRELYGVRGLTMIFVSVDRQRDTSTALARVLEAHGVHFTTYIKQDGNDEGFINAVNPAWSGALPATFIYDRHGSLIRTLIDRQSLDDLSHILQPLVNR